MFSPRIWPGEFNMQNWSTLWIKFDTLVQHHDYISTLKIDNTENFLISEPAIEIERNMQKKNKQEPTKLYNEWEIRRKHRTVCNP